MTASWQASRFKKVHAVDPRVNRVVLHVDLTGNMQLYSNEAWECDSANTEPDLFFKTSMQAFAIAHWQLKDALIGYEDEDVSR